MSDAQESSGPFSGPADRFRQEVERFVERVGGLGEKALDTMGLRMPGSWNPPADILETSDEVVVLLDVPGMAPGSLDVQITGNMLTINGSRPPLGTAMGSIVHAGHRPSGSFSRSIPMPVPVDHEKVSADVHDGVLTIRLAKPAGTRSRSIPIVMRTAPEDARPAGEC